MTIFQAFKTGARLTIDNVALPFIVFVMNIFFMIVLPLLFLSFGPPAKYFGYLRICYTILFSLIYVFVLGGMLGTLRDGIKESNSRINRFPFYGKKYFLRLLIFYIFMGITFLAAATAFFFVLSSLRLGMMKPIFLFVVLAVLLGIAVVYISVFWSFSPVVIIAEGTGINQAFKVTRKFFKTRLFRVIVLALALILIRFSNFAVASLMEGLTFVFSAVVGVVGSAIYASLNVIANASLMAFYMVETEEKNVEASDSLQTVSRI